MATTTNVTVSMETGVLDNVKAAAAAEGISFSAYMQRAAKSMWLRNQARKYQKYQAGPRDRESREAEEAWDRDAAARLLAAVSE